MEKTNGRPNCTIDEYGSVTIVITLKYLYSVLPLKKELTIDKALQIQIKFYVFLWYVIGFFIDSKNEDIFVCIIQEKY